MGVIFLLITAVFRRIVYVGSLEAQFLGDNDNAYTSREFIASVDYAYNVA